MSNAGFASAVNVDPDLPMTGDGLAYHLSCRAADVADRFLLVGDPARVAFVASFFDPLPPDHVPDARGIDWPPHAMFFSQHRELVVATGRYRGARVTCLSTGMGTDNAEIVMNEIHALKEYDVARRAWRVAATPGGAATATDGAFDPSRVKLIRVGTCGSPRAGIVMGTLAITQFAIGMDNTCRYYSRSAGDVGEAGAPDVPLHAMFDLTAMQHFVNTHTSLGRRNVGGAYMTLAHPTVTSTIAAACEAYNGARGTERPAVPYVIGATATGSGFYGCQGRCVGRLAPHVSVPHLVDELASLAIPVLPRPASGTAVEATVPVVNIEMETSALCYLANALGYEAGSVCVVVARRHGDDKAFASPDEAKRGLTAAVEIALDALVSMP